MPNFDFYFLGVCRRPPLVHSLFVLHVTKVYSSFQSNSEICYNELSTVAGLNPVMPSGAMYLMVSSQHVSQASFEYQQIFPLASL